MKNYFKVFLLSLFLLSCSNSGIYKELLDSLSILLKKPQDISLKEIQKVKYASIQVRLGGGQNTLLVLEEDREGILKWTSSNYIKVYTLRGIVIRLTGLGNELEKLEVDPNHPILNKDFDLNNPMELTSYFNFKNPNLFDLPIKTSFRFLKEEKIINFEEEINCYVFQEKSKKNLINWDFENTYWISKENLDVVKSIQSFSPKLEKIYIKEATKFKKPENQAF